MILKERGGLELKLSTHYLVLSIEKDLIFQHACMVGDILADDYTHPKNTISV